MKIAGLLLLLVATCNAYPTGAPLMVCNSMMPAHSVAPQTSNAPVTMAVSGTSYTASSTLTITITATAGSIKGFFLQARSAVNSNNAIAYGEFFDLPTTAKAINCNDFAGSAATHTSRDNKQSIVLKWRAPIPAGNIQFRLTVVQSFAVFWVGITSGVITGPGTAVIPTTIPVGVLIETISTSGCGTSKGCYRSPAGCSGSNCQYIATYAESGNDVNFEILYRPAPNTGSNWWAALGLSDDTRMGNDSVFACTRYGSQVYFKSFYNDYHTPEPISSTRAGVRNIFVSWMEGAIQCRFTRAKVPTAVGTITVPGAIKNLDNAHHMIFGFGNTLGGGNLFYHWATTPRVSAQVVNTAQIRNVNGVSSKTLVKVHAALMSIAWVWLAPMAIFCASYMKGFKTDCMGTAAWFQIHRSSMVSVVLLSITGFILVWVHAQRWSPGAGNHAYTGTATVALAMIQPIMAYFRCHPGEDKRWIFNYAHRTVGLLALGLGLGTVFLGMDLYLLDLPSFTTWTLTGFLIGLGLNVLVREILIVYKSQTEDTSVAQADIPMENKGDEKGDAPEVVQAPAKKEDTEVLSFFILSLCAVGTTATIIAGIVVYPF